MVMLIITCATCVGSLIYSMVVHYTPQNTSHSMLIKLYENENTVSKITLQLSNKQCESCIETYCSLCRSKCFLQNYPQVTFLEIQVDNEIIVLMRVETVDI